MSRNPKIGLSTVQNVQRLSKYHSEMGECLLRTVVLCMTPTFCACLSTLFIGSETQKWHLLCDRSECLERKASNSSAIVQRTSVPEILIDHFSKEMCVFLFSTFRHRRMLDQLSPVQQCVKCPMYQHRRVTPMYVSGGVHRWRKHDMHR